MPSFSRHTMRVESDPHNPHPDKKVPALVHDGTLVTESVAIIQYLTDQFPQAGLGPAIGDPRRGAYLTWLAYYAGVMEPVIAIEIGGLALHSFFISLRKRVHCPLKVIKPEL